MGETGECTASPAGVPGALGHLTTKALLVGAAAAGDKDGRHGQAGGPLGRLGRGLGGSPWRRRVERRV